MFGNKVFINQKVCFQKNVSFVRHSDCCDYFLDKLTPRNVAKFVTF